MAKSSVIAREAKRARICERCGERREILRKASRDVTLSESERFSAMLALQKLPRDSNPVRRRNRCALTGRARGFLRRFGLSRIKFREMASRGEIPGIRLASW